jgi:GPH family glycoside/pentoside/hexuronide:cation symporter
MSTPPHRPVSVQTKLAYGLGQIGEQVKNQGFGTFLFFYFTQVLGLSGSLAGAAVLIALAFDAVTDPLAGSLSDNWKSPRGRRHPFMYAAAVPLAIFWYVLFVPPAGLGQIGLFLWLTTFAILVRGAMTLYHVPHLALGAELSTDYIERTSIVTWRTLLAVGGGVATTVISYSAFFPETEAYQNGMLNPAGYPNYAIFGSIVMLTTIWYSAWGTRNEIPHLPKAPANPEPFSARRIVDEFRIAWENVSFRSVFIGFTLFGVFFGIVSTLGTHMNVFFWSFDTDQLQILALPWAIGFLIAGGTIARVHQHFEKAPVLIAACVGSGVLGNALVLLRIFGLMPENGSPFLLPIVFVVLCAMSTIAAMGFISAGSMMADIAEQHEVRTGKAQQGVFFSSTSFSSKMASGLGHFVAGVGLDLIAFPLQADPSTVPVSALTNLGLLSLAAATLTIFAIWSFRGYRIDRAEYARTRAILTERAALLGVELEAEAPARPATTNPAILPEPGT